jgi:LytS/YehU family sensor histidine kinase
MEDGMLRISVINTGRRVAPSSRGSLSQGSESGLENVKRRLERSYPHRHRIHEFEKDGAVHVVVEIREDEHDVKEQDNTGNRG